jgi:hypothetical protein
MNENVINGSIRARDGTFWMQSHRQFAADGREHRSIDRLLDLVHRYDTLLPYTTNPSIEVALRAIRDARNISMRSNTRPSPWRAVPAGRGGRSLRSLV